MTFQHIFVLMKNNLSNNNNTLKSLEKILILTELNALWKKQFIIILVSKNAIWHSSLYILY